MKQIIADPGLIAYCGLYCGACKAYLKEKCLGCHQNEKASWCKVRTCCTEQGYTTCADCQLVDNLTDCKKLNNLIAKFFALVFRSDREACLRFIAEQGPEAYAAHMAEHRIVALRK